jgi:taurine dioxygenase
MIIQPVSPFLGAEVIGADLSEEITFQQLYQAWVDANGVLVIRDQHLTPEQHLAFSRRFGALAEASENPLIAKYYLPGYPGIFRVSNKKIDGEPQGREDAGTYWHSDGTWQTHPSKASLLHALEVPPTGGDTMFANLYRAYDLLSEEMQVFLGHLQAVHSVSNAAGTSYAREIAGKETVATSQAAIHPVVYTHPDSGRKALFVNRGYTSHILGLRPAESEALLNFLFQHTTAPENIYRHNWHKHDLVIWDNRCTVHYAVADYKASGDRYMHRTSVKGSGPL